ncbi:MAG: matrixin family metalloprotease [Lacunisphaera sp.]|nr:matrixin family metalloprotease [Lacunisphaera sp.]
MLRTLIGGLAALALSTSGLGYTFILNASTGLPIKWPGATALQNGAATPVLVPLNILLDNTTVRTDGTTFATSAQGAAQTWNALLGSMQFTTTISTGAPTDHNHVNELAMATTVFGSAFDTSTIAVTTTWRLGNDRTEADIIFNAGRTWDSYAGNLRSGVVDIHRVALHEMGHILGLDHPDEATPPQTISAVMNSHISNLDTLAMDDITGAQNLYGPPGPPLNDKFSSATVINNLTTTGTVAYTGFNTFATKETGEPNHAGNAGGHSVWWKWTAPAVGNVTVDTRGSYYDTTLGIYTGTSVSALTTIASNDDINSGVVQASTVTFSATAGTVYNIAVDGFDGDTAGITLNVTFSATSGTAPTITTQPASVTVTAGSNAAFSVVAAAGTSPISYQWMFNGAAISGATSATLSLNSVTSASGGSYTVVVSTGAGSVTSSDATLTVNTPVVVTPTPPPSSSGGGGGGGAPSVWFLLSLGAAGLARFFRRR